MKKVTQAFLAAIFLAVSLGAAGFAGGGGETSLSDYKQYRLDGKKFFLYLTKDNPYTAWPLWPTKGELSPPGGEAHGSYVTTYVNPKAYRAITQKEDMAYGSLIVMESYGPDKNLTSLAAKVKLKRYNPPGGDWYWFTYAPDGTVKAEGRVVPCLDCHGKNKTNDYILTAPLK
ncbi:MAG: cytochrome P460 family protein [Syntrophales bacterium]